MGVVISRPWYVGLIESLIVKDENFHNMKRFKLVLVFFGYYWLRGFDTVIKMNVGCVWLM